MNEDKVTTKNPKYDELATKRKAFHAVKGGTDAIQTCSTTYLPKYPAEADAEYKARLKSSTIDGIVQSGVETLTGTFFEGEIDVSKVNPSIVPLLENIDNCGNHFNVFVRNAVDASFDGSATIVVDMPIETEQTQALRRERGAEADVILNSRPYWVLYKADDVINWRYRENPITKVKELALLVVKVVTNEPDGIFKTKDVTRYRVWMLNGNSVEWQLWEQREAVGVPADAVQIGGGILASMTRIPAAIMGDLTDEPKLLVESRLEIKAYQKESSFDVIEYLSVPTFFTKGYDGDEPLALGASGHVKLPLAGDIGFVQIDSAGLEGLKASFREIKDNIKQRVNQTVTSAMPQKTATETMVQEGDKQARLLVWAEQAKDAVEQALSYTAEFMGLGLDKGGEIAFQTKWAVAEQKAKEADAMKAEQDKANIAATMAKANG